MNNGRPDIRSMEAFAAVVECGSMTAAAQKLSVGQPSVTRMIRDLEDRVGFNLFNRNGPKISLSEKGIKFYEESQRVMASLSHLTERAHAIRDEKMPAIDLVATPTMSAGLVGPVLSRVSDILPDFIYVETTTSARVMHALRHRTADVGFSAYSKDLDQLKCLAKFECSVVAVVQKGSKFDTDTPIPLTAFETERTATICGGYQIRDEINKTFEAHHIEIKSEISTNSSLSAAMAAKAGLGIALCDPVTAIGVPLEGVSVRPLSVPINYDWGMFAREDTILDGQYLRLIEACQQEGDQIVSKVQKIYGKA
ncbi:LysR family transcriptional regulator [Celeribacter sp. ASW11-22]|nr:LysR family transcriptional regulator [Celeribacter litoreus]